MLLGKEEYYVGKHSIRF